MIGRGLLAFLLVRMKREARQYLLLILISLGFGVGVWAVLRFTSLRRHENNSVFFSDAATLRTSDPDLWARNMDKLKEPRAESENVAIEIPSELRHYEDRHWFLATQVAEVKKFNVQPVQDFVDLAAMIQRGEMVPVQAVTDTYILYGVAARTDGSAFTRYVANQNVELNDDTALRDAYVQLESAHAKLQKVITNLQTQLAASKKGAGAKQDELQKELDARQRELRSNEDNKAQLDKYYGRSSSSSGSQATLLRDYDSLENLAKDFRGRSFDLNNSNDRQTLKIYLLSSLRPPALKILEEIARAYHDKFDRPLPVSSLIRPEQYQHVLRRFNRYAVLIDTPPHSTGLAFDIDYRFMSGAEQNFLMSLLARMKDDGRIEVLRERGANYHVFAFIDGTRPDDDLIKASLPDAGAPDNETNPDENDSVKKTPVRVDTKSRLAKKKKR
ncbi:MAG: hypothetical protein DMF72_20305 [Acidobacteria bacterium]|nr:MAG: hypothetical protein DMF72_20305 [Acidobacteriota bacterium]